MEKFKISNLSDIEEIEKVPLEVRLSAFNTYDLLKQGVSINSDAPAISFIPSGEVYDSPQQLTYHEFMAQVNQAANLFYDLGIGPRDVISYLLPNLLHTHYVLWGGEAAGIVNPINPMLEPSVIRELCDATGTKVLVALGEMPETNIWQKVSSIRKDLPDLKAIIRVMGPGDEKEGVYGYDEVIDRYSADKLDSGRVIDPQNIASIYHTGGTTGRPKLAPRTHLNEAAMAFMLGSIMDLKAGEVSLCGLPLFHANGTTVTGSVPFSIGAHVVLLSPRGYRDPAIIKNFYKIVEHYRAVHFSAVPTILSMLLDIPKGDIDISSLRSLNCGASPLSVELFQRFEAITGMKIIEGYGLTEGTCGSSVNPTYGKRKVGSIGLHVPYQDVKVFMLDDDGNFMQEAETNEIGSICIKGPNVFSGYTEGIYNSGIWPKEGWFNTGDLGRQDADGYFWLTGRKKDLIIRGGHNIDPAIIEAALYGLEGVRLAAAVGRPDPHAGEVPVAYVQLQEDTDLTPDQILDYLKSEMGERAAIPKTVVILEQMPLTSVGKIFKPALRREAVKSVYESKLSFLGEMAHSIQVIVNEDKVYGTLAVIRIEPALGVSKDKLREKVSEILNDYTIKYRTEII